MYKFVLFSVGSLVNNSLDFGQRPESDIAPNWNAMRTLPVSGLVRRHYTFNLKQHSEVKLVGKWTLKVLEARFLEPVTKARLSVRPCVCYQAVSYEW